MGYELYTARWAWADEIAAAGLHNPDGLYFGQTAEGLPLRLASDMPLITFGGTGSGKGRDVLPRPPGASGRCKRRR